MTKQWVIFLMALLAGLLTTLGLKTSAHSSDVCLHQLDNPTYKVLYVTIPAQAGYQVVPVVSSKLDLVGSMVSGLKQPVLAGINAGFFDPSNKLTTSYVIQHGQVVADPTQNTHFYTNPDLAPYLPHMLNRSAFRTLRCAEGVRYSIARQQDALPAGCTLQDSLQAGPNLLTPNSAEAEAFIATRDGQRIRDPLGVDRKNARSAVGIDGHGNVILAMVSMKPLPETPTGVTLAEMAQVMIQLGAEQALALDGGSSSTLWYEGTSYYGKLDKAMKPVKRPVKSALVVIREE